MAAKPRARILDTFTIRNMAGYRVTVHAVSTADYSRGEWIEGLPELKTDRGVQVYELGPGQYAVGQSGEIYTRVA